MKVVIAGGTGFLGTLLKRDLLVKGHEVIVLSRNPKNHTEIKWDGKSHGTWEQSLEGADVLINMAGRSVNCRYNAKNKAEIYASRLDSTRILGQAIANAACPPKLWINSSTATIYRHAEDRPMDEDCGEVGSGFSVDVAQKWEDAFFSATPCSARRVALRSAMVMGHSKHSAFTHFQTVVKLGLGGPEGSGTQMVSWIHAADWLAAVYWIIDHDEIRGPINLSSPNPLSNREFLKVLRGVLHVPIGLPLAKWMLTIGAFFLRTETELLFKSRWVLPKHLLQSGFQFQYPNWREAAQELSGNVRGTIMEVESTRDNPDPHSSAFNPQS
ncbi:MAG TPA: TIGR01777 family oxidoreductase [Fimbriimonadaceae bacterium]|jgi:hypothetical protein